MQELLTALGHMDIYLIDQLQKRRWEGYRTVMDLGCGGGRNLGYFLRAGWEVHGLDAQATAIAVVRELSRSLAPANSVDHFQVGEMQARPWGKRRFDLVICNAVLHFAQDDAMFADMLSAAWEAVAPGGMLFVRLASNIGIEDRVQPLGNGQFLLPDGSTRYLVDEATLLEWRTRLGARALEPIKTTNVQGLRCMTTLVWGRD